MRLKPVNDKIVEKPTEDKNDNVTDGGTTLYDWHLDWIGSMILST